MNFFSNHNLNEKNREKELIKNALLNNISEGLVVANEQGTILYSNDLAIRIMEAGLFGPIDIVSRNPKEFRFEDHDFEVRYDKLPEDFEIKGTIASMVDKRGNSVYAAQVAELTEKLEKLSGFKSAFLANMSHEIRTPIHAIIGFAELILKNELTTEVSSQIDMIKESSYSLLAIINDVLDLSKIESGKMELVCSNYYISYVIRDIEATYSMMAMRKGLKFEIHLDDNIPSNMYGDKIRIRGTLINLLSNAIKFTKEGRVDFYIHVLEKKDGIATLQFVVKDTGIGIKEEDQEKIFESFSKFDMNTGFVAEGRGLGLSIAKGYMDLMGGTISVKSDYGIGSTFTVTLNQKIVDDSPVDMNIVNARKKKTGSKLLIHDYKVLVADDNPVNLTVAEGLMRSYGLTAETASGGQEAINLCMHTQYDIIFMDQMMPEVDGIKAMNEIRKISEFYENKCKIVVLTADAMAGVRDRLLKEGFDEYLCKPLEIHRLENTLLQFVPEDHIYTSEEQIPKAIVIEESKAVVVDAPNTEDELSRIAEGLGISVATLEKKIRDCGGDLSDYRTICEIANKHSESKIEKLRESQTIKDYNRYTIEVHALKSSLASLGAMDLADLAREHEEAGKNGDFRYIDEEIETLISDYEEFMDKVRVFVLGMETKEESEKPTGEEWSKEEMTKISRKMIGYIEEYNFGAIFELIDDLKKMDMGPETRQFFDELETAMNNMEIDTVRTKLGERA